MKYLIIILIFSNSLWSQNISEHKWKDRIIVIKGSRNDSNLVEQQFNVFSKIKNQLIERKLVIYKCIENHCILYDWSEKPRMSKLDSITPNFEILLIGLDGYEKFKSYKVVEPMVILNLIDKMPMRRQEVKENRKNND
jgi:Domain of unknown function (DUF4174)